MEAFAERARVELEATGERARKRTWTPSASSHAGNPDLPARRPATHQPGDRRFAVHQSEHGRNTPPQVFASSAACASSLRTASRLSSFGHCGDVVFDVLGLMNSKAAISRFVSLAASREIWVSCGVSSPMVSSVLLRARSPVASSSTRARSAKAHPELEKSSCRP